MQALRWLLFRCSPCFLALVLAKPLGAAPLAWYPGPALNNPVSGAATVSIRGGNILLLGGDYADAFSFPQSLASTNSYWSSLPALPGVRSAAGAVASGGLIIVYGGSDGTNALSSVVGYSTSGDTPLMLASLIPARSHFGYAPDASGNAYAIGGCDDQGQALASVERYNADAAAWATITPLPFARCDFPAVFDLTNQIYIFGGRTNSLTGPEISTVLRYSVKTANWTALPSLPVAVAGAAAALGPDGNIYVVGGWSSGWATNLVQVYNVGANVWTLGTPLPEALSESSVGVDSLGRLVVMGGQDANGEDVADVWRSQPLGIPDAAPIVTQFPSTVGTYEIPYVSAIAATGNPPPQYFLLQGPASMSLAPDSGILAWTPLDAGVGTNPVTIRATNYAGYEDWSFTITVPNPSPPPPTNLVVVNVTDDAVTLSWDPLSPIYGPVTYTAYLRHFIHDPKGSGGTVWYTAIGTNTRSSSLTISGLAPGTSQDYYLVATGPGGSSGYVANIRATTTGPQGPPTLAVTDLASTSVSLAWAPAPGPAQNTNYSAIQSYAVMERNTAVYPPANVPVLTNITGTSATLTGLTPGSSHFWFVAGVDAAGYASPLTYVYVTVTNPIPLAPKFLSLSISAGGTVQFQATESGAVLQTVWLQATTNPADPGSWVSLGSWLPQANPFLFTASNAAAYPARFFRLVAP